MLGEASIGGVYVPWLLILTTIAAVLTALLSRLLSLIGLDRLVLYRPLNDSAMFLLLLAGAAWLSGHWGIGR